MQPTDEELNHLALRLSRRSHYEDGPLETQCIIWHGATNPNGYGVMKWRGVNWGTHCLGFTLYNKRLPKLYTLHRCDNRACWAGDHLFEGSPLDNTQDMIVKGRFVASNVKLTHQQVTSIRQLVTEGKHTHQEIADQFNVHKSTITKIKLNEIW